jgi:tripeptide aminopeptidase
MNATTEKILDMAIEIQQIPAPTFHEQERAAFVRELFLVEGDLTVEMDQAGNVLACRKGSGEKPPIVVCAHLDTVFPQDTNLKFSRTKDRIYGAGIGDNSAGVAGLFGLLWLLKERGVQLPGDLWLAANVGEEGLGNLKGIQAIVERFGRQPRAYIILEGMALGHIYNRALGVRRFEISISTNGGHSWSDFGQPSAIHELTNLAATITKIAVPRKPRTTINIGKIAGGTSVNTIAADASMAVDIRSEKTDALESVVQELETLTAAAQKKGVRVEIIQIGTRPAGEISEDHPLVVLAQDCIRELGLKPTLNIGSTDANLPLSLGLPAITIGLTNGNGAHTKKEHIYTEPLQKGLEQLYQLVTRVGKTNI